MDELGMDRESGTSTTKGASVLFFPAELERIINRALEKDRELRYQGAAEMRSELMGLKRDTDSSRSASEYSSELATPETPPEPEASNPAVPVAWSMRKLAVALAALVVVLGFITA